MTRHCDVDPAAQSTATQTRCGRPSHTEHWNKVTVVLMDREIVFIDRLLADIRGATGAALSRTHLIRALIDALAESDLDLTARRSEQELIEALAQRFRH
jgi:hypothetical protein